MMHKPHTHITATLGAVILCYGCAVGQTETPHPTAQPIVVTIHTNQIKRDIPKSFLGINLSYFNDTDEIWEQNHIQDKVKKAGIGALRYPGGEETSFFHWQHPGVNGYEDIHDDPATFGNPRHRGPFQVTWVAPEKWETNTSFMSFDDYMARCRALGAEPVVGINLSCGRAHDRRADGLEEALQWMRYCKEKDFNVTYWFLDNEPWHFEAAYRFDIEEYAEDVVYFGKAIKKEFPNVKLIVNPASSETINHKEGIRRFIRETGDVIDFIDIHWYWSWGTSSWDKWLAQTPMRSGDQWKDDYMDRPYGEDVEMIRQMCRDAGHPSIGVMVLEWNVGPSDHIWDLPENKYALIQSQMLMQFLDSGVEMTSLWTLLWQSRREIWPTQDRFQSIITHGEPYRETPTLEMMHLFSSVLGMQQVAAESSADDLVVIAARDEQGEQNSVLILNKSADKRAVSIRFDEKIGDGQASAEYFGQSAETATPITPDAIDENSMTLHVEPCSFTAIRIDSDGDENPTANDRQ